MKNFDRYFIGMMSVNILSLQLHNEPDKMDIFTSFVYFIEIVMIACYTLYNGYKWVKENKGESDD